MQSRPPSRTALVAAAHRAAHQKLEGGNIFADPFAYTILGKGGLALVDEAESQALKRPLRLFIAARSRFAEDCLSVAVSRGVSEQRERQAPQPQATAGMAAKKAGQELPQRIAEGQGAIEIEYGDPADRRGSSCGSHQCNIY